MRFPLPFLISSLAVGFFTQSPAAEPVGYYNSAQGLTGAALRLALHNIIKGHVSKPYGETTNLLKTTDVDPNDPLRVILVYSRRHELAADFINNTNALNPWNKEHLWPNSLGIDDVLPAYSDLHNLRTADVDVNQTRGNLIFDETNITGRIFPGDPEAPLTSRDGDSWEPPIEVKGDIARALFYMDVRYEGDTANELNLQLTDNLALVTNASTYCGRLTTLLLWHLSDPPSPEEKTRNDAVYGIQQNRNPFVDHPEMVFPVFGNPLELTGSLNPAGTTVTLTWWAELNGVTVEAADSPTQTTWTTLNTTASTLNGTQRTLNIPKSTARRFFRLRYIIPDGP